jgi:hypothetical protein
VRGAFPAVPAAKFFRRLNFPVCPAPESGEAASAHHRCTLQRADIESPHVAETSILSALPRYRQFSAANFVKQNLRVGALPQGKRHARGGAARHGGYTQN